MSDMSKIANDPVCEMEVDVEDPPASYEYEGCTYYFCAPGCKKRFKENPEEYLEKRGRTIAP